jgi:hypothetical protein
VRGSASYVKENVLDAIFPLLAESVNEFSAMKKELSIPGVSIVNVNVYTVSETCVIPPIDPFTLVNKDEVSVNADSFVTVAVKDELDMFVIEPLTMSPFVDVITTIGDTPS